MFKLFYHTSPYLSVVFRARFFWDTRYCALQEKILQFELRWFQRCHFSDFNLKSDFFETKSYFWKPRISYFLLIFSLILVLLFKLLHVFKFFEQSKWHLWMTECKEINHSNIYTYLHLVRNHNTAQMYFVRRLK